MKKILLFILFSPITFITCGQNTEAVKYENATIYEYGVTPTSCESNFENLFHNWSKWITNYQETKLISYQFVGLLTDSALVEKYADTSANWQSLLPQETVGNSEESNGVSIKNKQYHYFNLISIEDIPTKMKIESNLIDVFRKEWESNFKIMKKAFKDAVQIGDKIYKIKIEISGKIYYHYVFCRPSTNKVIYDPIFLHLHN